MFSAVGAAVGLGNIWKFPYITGEYGGGAFVLVYLITVMLVGFSVMISEMLIGYLGRRDCVNDFESLAPRHKRVWKHAGWMGFTGSLVMIYYSVVIGWILNYIVTAMTHLPASVDEAEQVFGTLLTQSVGTQIFYHTLAFLITTAVVAKGIKGGIEKFNLALVPLLMVILGVMFVYASTLGSFAQAADYMFTPDWSKLNSEAFVTAVGHAFFTLSLGMGSIMVYSASLPKEGNLVKSSMFVIAGDTIIALVAGMVLFTFLFQYGSGPAKGPGLVFISLPAVFYAMGTIGTIFAVLFFIALAFAGLTSAVSLVEPMVQYLIDKYKMSRLKAAVVMGMFFYLLGIAAILSQIEWSAPYLTWGGKNFFDWADYVTSAVMLPVAGFIMAIFVGYVIERERVASILEPQMGRFFGVWYFSVRYIAPVALVIVMLNLMGIIAF